MGFQDSGAMSPNDRFSITFSKRGIEYVIDCAAKFDAIWVDDCKGCEEIGETTRQLVNGRSDWNEVAFHLQESGYQGPAVATIEKLVALYEERLFSIGETGGVQ